MRTIVIDRATDLQALSRRLAVGGNSQRVVETLRRLNPHANPDDIPPGTVLFVDDDAPVDRKATHGAELGALGQMVAQLQPAMDEAIARALERLADRARENKDVADALKLTGAKRALSQDPDIKKRADEFARDAKAQQARSDAAASALKELHTGARAELERLAKLARS